MSLGWPVARAALILSASCSLYRIPARQRLALLGRAKAAELGALILAAGHSL